MNSKKVISYDTYAEPFFQRSGQFSLKTTPSQILIDKKKEEFKKKQDKIEIDAEEVDFK